MNSRTKIIAIFLVLAFSTAVIGELGDAGFTGGLGDSGFTSGLGDAGFTSGLSDAGFTGTGGLSGSGSFSGSGTSFTDSSTGFTQDLPARWQSLENKQIPKNAQDNTIVYSKVASRCDDPDGPEFVTVVSGNLNYNLFMDNGDLKIRNLFNDYQSLDQVTLSCNGVEASFNLQIGVPFGGARWQPLSNQFVAKGSPDGTIAYPNIVLNCFDNTPFLTFKVLSSSNNYQLFIIGRDLRMYGLNPLFEGTETVSLSCNDAAASFQLTVGEELQQRFEQQEELEVHIGTIAVPEQTEAGTIVPVIVSFRNTGDEKLEDVKVRVVIPELGAASQSAGPFDLSRGKRTTQTLLVELPEDVLPDVYTVRLTIDSASLHRVVHRDLVVE